MIYFRLSHASLFLFILNVRHSFTFSELDAKFPWFIFNWTQTALVLCHSVISCLLCFSEMDAHFPFLCDSRVLTMFNMDAPGFLLCLFWTHLVVTCFVKLPFVSD